MMSTCILVDGHLYGFGDDTFACVDWATGELKWQETSLGKGAFIRAGNHLLVMSEGGELAVVDPSPEAYKELARSPAVEARSWVLPVLANGKIFCRNNNGEAVCFDVSAK